MSSTNITQVYASDLILWEPLARNGREMVTVNYAGGTLSFGHILFRVKSIDPTAVWAPLVNGSDVLITNEYAVFLGDRYDLKDSLAVVAATATPVLTIRRQARLKETLPKTLHVNGSLTLTQFNLLKEALKTQGIILESVTTEITP